MAFPRRGKIDPEKLAYWKRRQAQLRDLLVIAPLNPMPRFVAGVDCAFGADGKAVYAVALVWDRATHSLIEQRGVRCEREEPYIPGYLSFREGPTVHAALGSLSHPYGAVLFDGQGIAHPRGCGMATHVAVERDVPGVGCAKSRLIGTHGAVGPRTGDAADLLHEDRIVGRVLRTRDKTRALFISIGHRCDLDSAVALVLACRTRYRLPEPTRLADAAVARLKRGEDVTVSPFAPGEDCR